MISRAAARQRLTRLKRVLLQAVKRSRTLNAGRRPAGKFVGPVYKFGCQKLIKFAIRITNRKIYKDISFCGTRLALPSSDY